MDPLLRRLEFSCCSATSFDRCAHLWPPCPGGPTTFGPFERKFWLLPGCRLQAERWSGRKSAKIRSTPKRPVSQTLLVLMVKWKVASIYPFWGFAIDCHKQTPISLIAIAYRFIIRVKMSRTIEGIKYEHRMLNHKNDDEASVSSWGSEPNYPMLDVQSVWGWTFQSHKKIGAAPLGPPLTLRNYMLQRARQHTDICVIGRFSIYFS